MSHIVFSVLEVFISVCVSVCVCVVREQLVGISFIFLPYGLRMEPRFVSPAIKRLCQPSLHFPFLFYFFPYFYSLRAKVKTLVLTES